MDDSEVDTIYRILDSAISEAIEAVVSAVTITPAEMAMYATLCMVNVLADYEDDFDAARVTFALIMIRVLATTVPPESPLFDKALYDVAQIRAKVRERDHKRQRSRLRVVKPDDA